MRKSITTGLIALLAIVMCAAIAQAQNPTSGQTGPLTWKYDTDTKTLTISGQGEMPNYDREHPAPWQDHNQEMQKLVVEEGVTGIGDYAFRYADNLISVTLPKTATRIGDRSFVSCKSLSTISIPAGVIKIGPAAFGDCESLTSVTLPDGLKEIAHIAFTMCYELATVTIPASVETIGTGAFSDCGSLSAITVAAGNANYVAVDGVLFNKAKTMLFQYPAGRADTSYVIPAGVTNIKEQSFDAARRLTSVTLPASVKVIGDGAFSGCKNLKSLTVGMKTPPDIDKKDVFEQVSVANATLTVPKGSKAAYAAAPVWKEFKQIAESTVANATVPEARIYAAEGLVYMTLPQAATIRIYNLNGVLVRSLTAPAGLTTVALPEGIYIVRTGEHTEKVFIH
ncbi:hypothetical protein BHU09_04850 [Tannerella sp. oral taxon 808]|nr:hypothetical protein BHU09_04850 [Tannerella sp. oral taxon 808]